MDRQDCLSSTFAAVLFLAAVGFQQIAAAAEATITVVPRNNAAPRSVTVALIPGESKNETREIETKLHVAVKAELPPGIWYLEVRGAGVWHQRQAVFLGERAAITAEVWPRATLQGRAR